MSRIVLLTCLTISLALSWTTGSAGESDPVVILPKSTLILYEPRDLAMIPLEYPALVYEKSSAVALGQGIEELRTYARRWMNREPCDMSTSSWRRDAQLVIVALAAGLIAGRLL